MIWKRGPLCRSVSKGIPKEVFSGGEMGHLSLQCRRGPLCFGCRELGHTAVYHVQN